MADGRGISTILPLVHSQHTDPKVSTNRESGMKLYCLGTIAGTGAREKQIIWTTVQIEKWLVVYKLK